MLNLLVHLVQIFMNNNRTYKIIFPRISNVFEVTSLKRVSITFNSDTTVHKTD